MTIRKTTFALIASSFSLICFSGIGHSQTKDGAVLGGVAGAVIGGIIGHQNQETPEGALIGGAVGAVAGGMLGKQHEQQRQIQYYQQQQAYHQRYATPVYTAPAYTSTVRATQVRRPVSASDVITLARGGISEAVIANHVLSNGVVQHPNVDEVLTMHDAGVSDFVIDAMQKAPIGETVVVTPMPVQTTPVVIHEEYHPAPVYVTRPIYQPAPSYYLQFGTGPTYLAHPHHRRHY